MPRVSPIQSFIISVPQHLQFWGPVGLGPAPAPQFGQAAGDRHLPSFLLPCAQDVKEESRDIEQPLLHTDGKLTGIPWSMGVWGQWSLLVSRDWGLQKHPLTPASPGVQQGSGQGPDSMM